MVVVSVGTNEARFDRLLEWVSGIRWEEAVFVQHGPSELRPTGAECVDYVSYDVLVGLVRRSRIFITHAGVGSILVSLSAGRRPIVVPRLKRHGEAVDDHQVPLATRLAAEGLVTVANTPEKFADAVTHMTHTVRADVEPTALVRELRSYLLDHCRPPG